MFPASSTRRHLARPLPCSQRHLHQAHGCMQRLRTKQRQQPAARAFRNPSSAGMHNGSSSSSSTPAAPPSEQGAAAAPSSSPLGSYIRDAAQKHAANQQQQQSPAPGNGTSIDKHASLQQGGHADSSNSNDTTTTGSSSKGCRPVFASIDELKATDPSTGSSKCKLYTGGVTRGERGGVPKAACITSARQIHLPAAPSIVTVLIRCRRSPTFMPHLHHSPRPTTCSLSPSHPLPLLPPTPPPPPLPPVGDVPGLPRNHTSRRGLLNKVQRSTYPDAIGDNLQQLSDLVDKHLGGEAPAGLFCDQA
jgi:hypothetical protein